MFKAVVYLRISGETERLGEYEFGFPPRAGEMLLLDRPEEKEELLLHIDRIEHRIDKTGHVARLMCSLQSGGIID